VKTLAHESEARFAISKICKNKMATSTPSGNNLNLFVKDVLSNGIPKRFRNRKTKICGIFENVRQSVTPMIDCLIILFIQGLSFGRTVITLKGIKLFYNSKKS
jgi:hypothetical protein